MAVNLCAFLIFVIFALDLCHLGVNSQVSSSRYCPPQTNNEEPIVQTKYGPVRGVRQYSRNSTPYYSFRGIPYAKPPLGSLRFKAPQPPNSWNDSILNCTEDGPVCIQKNYFFKDPKVEGQEDCLYLNIYVPENNDQQELLPVLVFIHWGGYFAGRGTSDYLDPNYLMDKNVILVTFNYRLGVMGFLTTLNDDAPGNYGLKDQVLALKFVQQNIANFGGDKDKVTISGQSAGGGSTSLHLISPSSRGLFRGVISQSGASLNLWNKPLNSVQASTVTPAQAVFVGCAQHLQNSTLTIDCLQRVDANFLVNSADNFKYFGVEPLTPFTLVTETKTEANPDPFLTKKPLEYLQAGEFQRVPHIIGNVNDEGILKAAPLLRQNDLREGLNGNFSNLIKQMLFLSLSASDPSDAESLYQNITNFYLGGDNFVNISNPDRVQGFIDLYSDRSFIYGSYQTVLIQALKNHTPIWMYNFAYRGELTYGDIFAATADNITFNWGVSHCDDLIYLFKSPTLLPELSLAKDICMSVTLVDLWTNFVIYGNPDPRGILDWNPIKADDVLENKMEILNISGPDLEDLKIVKGLVPERVSFWKSQSLAENFVV